MLTPREIQDLAERKFALYLQAIVTGESVFPMRIRFGVPSTTEDFVTLQKEVQTLANGNFGYTIEWEEKNTRRYGLQRLPSQVRFDSEEQFIRSLDKAVEVETFKDNVTATLQRLPQLKDWMASRVNW